MKEWINKHCTLKHILSKECTHIIDMKPPKVGICKENLQNHIWQLCLHTWSLSKTALQKLDFKNLILNFSMFSILSQLCVIFLLWIQLIQGEDIERDKAKQNLLECCQRSDFNYRKLTSLITWTTALSNSMKLWAMLCRATQDGWVMVESSDKRWSTGEGKGKPLQYSCLENPMNCMKRQKDRHWKMNSPGW